MNAHADKGYDELVPGMFHVPDDPAAAPYLIGGCCPKSGLIVFPRMALCPRCHSEMETKPIGRRAKLFSFTIARVGAEGFQAPYFQAYVELSEGPRVFSLISSDVPIEPDGLREGMAMELVIEPVRKSDTGREVLTYKYRPVGDQGDRR